MGPKLHKAEHLLAVFLATSRRDHATALLLRLRGGGHEILRWGCVPLSFPFLLRKKNLTCTLLLTGFALLPGGARDHLIRQRGGTYIEAGEAVVWGSEGAHLDSCTGR